MSPRRRVADDETLPDTALARRVLERARELGWNKAQMAEATGLSRQTLVDLLRCGGSPRARWPSVRTLLELARTLKVHPYWLSEAVCADARVSLHLSSRMHGDRAGFVEDSSVPDACVVLPGSRFVKTWTCQKLAPTDWTGCRLECWDERVDVRSLGLDGVRGALRPRRLHSELRSVSLAGLGEGDVFAGDIEFTAPQEPGPAFSYWVAVDARGEPMFTEHAGVAVIVWVSDGRIDASELPLASDRLRATQGCEPKAVRRA